MLKKVLRSFRSLELSPTVPPKILLEVSSHSKEYKLSPTKTLGELFTEIREDAGHNSSLEVKLNNKKVLETALLGSLTKTEFTLIMDNKEIHVSPGMALFTRDNERYYSKCHEFGIPFNESRTISRFLETLERQLPDTFDNFALESALETSKTISSSFAQEEVSILKSQLQNFKQKLEPLEKTLEELKRKSERFADGIVKLGLGVLFTQWFGIAYGTFALYGWDVMEPITYMLGSTWAVVGFGFFVWQRQEFYPASFREGLYNNRLAKLMEKNKLTLERIELLRKNIDMIHREIELLES